LGIFTLLDWTTAANRSETGKGNVMSEELTRNSGPDKVAVAATSAPPASPPGYELLDEVGHGGMGVVYRARDVALDRDVAVKLLSERYPAGSPAAQRFLSEARITGQLQHPGIPAVHRVGTLADGRPFLAMKLIKGSTLEALLKQRPSPVPLFPEGRGEAGAERGRLLATSPNLTFSRISRHNRQPLICRLHDRVAGI
jgi:serine/threonine protein kinase